MTSSNYKTERFDKEHVHSGGLIYRYDFETDIGKNVRRRSDVADRIASDMKAEESCLKKRNKKYEAKC